jgi:hypothetical protein
MNQSDVETSETPHINVISIPTLFVGREILFLPSIIRSRFLTCPFGASFGLRLVYDP